jgi:hypothetical protein
MLWWLRHLNWYIVIWVPWHKLAMKSKKWKWYIYEHIYVAYEKWWDEIIWKVVHHKDFDKSNNNIDNLQLMTKQEHAKLHYIPIPAKIKECPRCWNTFSWHNKYCCKECHKLSSKKINRWNIKDIYNLLLDLKNYEELARRMLCTSNAIRKVLRNNWYIIPVFRWSFLWWPLDKNAE